MPDRGAPRQLPRYREGLPDRYTPRVAGYGKGPMIAPAELRPSEWTYRNARTYVATAADGNHYRVVAVYSDGQMVGYWAVELLGVPLDLAEWE